MRGGECGLTFLSQHLIDGLELGDFWSQPTWDPAHIDLRSSTEQPSVGIFSPTTTYTGPPPLFDNSVPFFERLPLASGALYSSGSSPIVSESSSLRLYGGASQQVSPSLYADSYISPKNPQGFDFYATDYFRLDPSESGVVASPDLVGSNLSDLGPAEYGCETMYRGEEAPKGESSSAVPRTKRTRTAPKQDFGAARSVSSRQRRPETGSDSSGKGKLRSASRTSKNTNQKSNETTEERKTRNAHNIVEKQYRNRLNARFEGLLGALPNSFRSPGSCDSNEEVRLSKGDVLDMSTTYIRTLESQRSQLEKEHEELISSIDRLHVMLANESQPNPRGFGSDGS